MGSNMISIDTYTAILDKISHPIVFVDNNHVIQYLNKPAQKRYYEQRGYSDLIGKSLFDCHNSVSRDKILAVHQQLKEGESEICIGVFKGEKITVVGVRDPEGGLIGYFERFEKSEQIE
jgi:PAS domain S-box-containing protein